MKKRKKIITLGASTVDIFVRPQKQSIFRIDNENERKEYLSFEYGAKIKVKDIHETLGGSAHNAAVTFSRLGIETFYCGMIGFDEWGEKIIKNLENEKISHSLVNKSKSKKTGFSVILNSFEGERTVLNYKGANSALSEKNIKKLDSEWLYMTHLEGEAEKALRKIVEEIDKNKILFAWNPGSTQIKKGVNNYKNLLKKTEIIFLNKEEAGTFTGKSFKAPVIGGKKCPECDTFVDEDGDGFPESIYNVKEIFKAFRDLGVKTIVITDGRRGTQVLYGNTIYYASSTGSKPVDTLGAGDSFASAFCSGIILGLKIEEALIWAGENAASVVNYFGAQKGILKKEEIKKRAKKSSIKIGKKKF